MGKKEKREQDKGNRGWEGQLEVRTAGKSICQEATAWSPTASLCL